LAQYLVTGGAGFIGLAMAKSLAARGHRVVLLDRPYKLERLPTIEGLTVFPADVADIDTYSELSTGTKFDAVLHLAAQTSARVSHENPMKDFQDNVKATLLLLEWCRKNKIKRFLYASSMAIYGEPKQNPVNEDAVPLPVSFYGVSKLAAEHYIRMYGDHGLQYTIFRLFNVYGPGQDMTNLKQGMVSIYLAYVLKNEEVPVTGSLERYRDFIHVDDVVNAWMLALDAPKSYGKTYNIGSGTKTTVREVLDLIIRACGYDPKAYPVRSVESHAGDMFGIISNCSSFQNDFSWIPQVLLAKGIKDMADWARSEKVGADQ
jgi:UDP-glucose 4-epimerase